MPHTPAGPTDGSLPQFAASRVTMMLYVFIIRNLLSHRDLRNNEISWAIEDANEAFVGLSRLDKLYVLQTIAMTILPRHAECKILSNCKSMTRGRKPFQLAAVFIVSPLVLQPLGVGLGSMFRSVWVCVALDHLAAPV